MWVPYVVGEVDIGASGIIETGSLLDEAMSLRIVGGSGGGWYTMDQKWKPEGERDGKELKFQRSGWPTLLATIPGLEDEIVGGLNRRLRETAMSAGLTAATEEKEKEDV